jgi:hypothetical protein
MAHGLHTYRNMKQTIIFYSLLSCSCAGQYADMDCTKGQILSSGICLLGNPYDYPIEHIEHALNMVLNHHEQIGNIPTYLEFTETKTTEFEGLTHVDYNPTVIHITIFVASKYGKKCIAYTPIVHELFHAYLVYDDVLEVHPEEYYGKGQIVDQLTEELKNICPVF